MRVGVTLPTFGDDLAAIEGARRAEELGLDGVFVFDHIWPMGRPDRPSISAFPVLGAVAAVTERVMVGSLVARVGLVPDDLLVAELLSLKRIAANRLVAGIGTGDHKSAQENLSYGITPGHADERRLALREVALRLVHEEVPVWVGGGSRATNELAVELGPQVALNLWGAQPSALASLAARTEVTWGGPLDGDAAEMVQWLSELATAGVSWAVCAWPKSLESLADVVTTARREGTL